MAILPIPCFSSQHNVYLEKSEIVSSAGLPSGGGRGPTPAHDDPGTGARAPESAVTTPPALARTSAETGKKSESGDRKAFRHPKTRHSVVSHHLLVTVAVISGKRLSRRNGLFVFSRSLIENHFCLWTKLVRFKKKCVFHYRYCVFIIVCVFVQFAVLLSGSGSWTKEHSSRMLPVYWKSLARLSP